MAVNRSGQKRRYQRGWVALAVSVDAIFFGIDAALTGQTIVIGLLAAAPLVAAMVLSARTTAWIAGYAFALAIVAGQVDGVFLEREHITALLTVVGGGALAVVLAELQRRARVARRVAEMRADQLSFLARVSEALSSSLDYEETLAKVAELAVPRVADWCSIDLISASGSLHNVSVAHADPEKVALARQLQRTYPARPEDPAGIHEVIRTAKPELYPDIPDELLVAGARDDEHLRISRELSLSSAMILPLVNRGRTFGTLSFVAAESGRHYDEQDLAFAGELAARAAIAIENARLYREVERSAATERDFNTAVLDTAAAIVIVLDHDGRITRFNPAAEDVSGRRAGDVFGHTVWSLGVLPDDDAVATREVFDRVLAGDYPTAHESKWAADEGTRYISWAITAIPDEEHVAHVVCIGLDVTASRSAEERVRHSQARMAEAERIAHFGSFEWDVVADDVQWSEELSNIFDLPHQEHGRKVADYLNQVHPEDRPDVEEQISAAVQYGRPFATEERIVRPDGSVRRIETVGRVVTDEEGRVSRVVGVCHDVTERKLAEEALAHASVELERHELSRRQAVEINDNIIQSLVVAKYSHAGGDTARAERALEHTLSEARRIVAELQRTGRVAPGELRRHEPVRIGDEDQS